MVLAPLKCSLNLSIFSLLAFMVASLLGTNIQTIFCQYRLFIDEL
jgi:hypothetical protein